MSYRYIEYNDRIYVPRASVCYSIVRNDLFLKHMGKEPLIVGPREWDLLASMSKITNLVIKEG